MRWSRLLVVTCLALSAVPACARRHEAAPPAEAPEPSSAPAGQGQPGYAPPGYGQQPTGGQAAPQQYPPSSTRGDDQGVSLDTETFADVGQAEALLSLASGTLDELFGPKDVDRDGTESDHARQAKPKASKKAGGDTPCVTACKAIASMRRAAQAVCRLAGDDTERCKKAQTLLDESEKRVAACQCPPPPPSDSEPKG